MKRSRLRRILEELRRRVRSASGAGREQEVAQQLANEFTTEELKEFLEGDLHSVEADPVFQAKLRQELWQLVQKRYGGRDERLD